MPNLQVRDIPGDLYENLVKVAKEQNRSIAQETVVLLRSALTQPGECVARRRRILGELDTLAIDAGTNSLPLPNPVDLVREDRER